MRVAIIKLGALGDVVRTTSLLPGLKRLDQSLELTWITSAAAAPLLRHHPDIRHVRTPDEPGEWRESAWDWVISLDDDAEARRLASRLRAQRLSGALEAQGGRPTYTPDLDEWFGMGLLRSESAGGLRRANELKRANGRTCGEMLYEGLGLPGPVEPPAVYVPPAAREAAARVLRKLGLPGGGPEGHGLVALNTGAGPRWKYKSWGEDQTAELARRVHDQAGTAVLVAGGPGEVDRNARIAAAAGRAGIVAAPVIPDLLAFAALLGACDVVVSSDSLAMHLAVAQRVPVVAFFGPTSDAEIDLFGLGTKVVTPLACRRCYLRDCDVRPDCMASIPVDRLFDAAAPWLGVRPRAAS